MRGRPKKAQVNDVVLIRAPKYGVVVAHNLESNPPYFIIETDALGRNPRGAAVQYEATDFTSTGRTSKRPGRIHRANMRLGPPEMRGCASHCCVHVAGIEPEPE